MRKATIPRWVLRNVRPRDFKEVKTLFREVFVHPLSRALWGRTYAGERGNAVIASRIGPLIAHYDGMYRDVMLCGQTDWVFQICGVMVHPQERGVMTRQAPFLLTAASSVVIYRPLDFGFSNARAKLVPAKLDLYSKAGQMSEVCWQSTASRVRMCTRVTALVRGNAASQALVESLWMAMAQDIHQEVVGVRNFSNLNHRYFGHPHNKYEVLAVTSRFTGTPWGQW